MVLRIRKVFKAFERIAIKGLNNTYSPLLFRTLKSRAY